MTTTIMEQYDAQMLDYQNDHDIQMQASSSDPWFQDEAAMEDVGNLAYQPKTAMTDAMPSIEVDMEAYVDDQHIEYDMADDHHNPTPGELLDVDLLDASRIQSPFVTAAPLPLTPSVEYPHTQFPSHPATISSTSDVSLNVPPPVPLDHIVGPTTFVDPVSEVPPAIEVPPLETEQLPTSSHTSNGINRDSETANPTADGDSSSEHRDSARHSSVASQPTAQAQPAVEIDDVPDGSAKDADQNESHPPEPVQDPVQAETEDNTEESTRIELGHPQNAVEEVKDYVSNSIEPDLSDATKATFDSQISSGHPANTGRLSAESTKRVAPHEDNQEAENEDRELVEAPSEDSEEVYLDAPPPILLSIFSTDHPELCLFNPTEPLPNEDDYQERHVLLQQTPALYYEPLVNVFEVLRQDEYVSTVLELAGSELAFDAYELELTISEDNVHAREISLHDIHLLHASANLAGALRLRLHIIGPRFIVRYHMLQEGLINLHVDESQNSGTDEENDDLSGEATNHEVGNIPEVYAEADDVAPVELPRFETTEHSEDQPQEEEQGRKEEYYDPHHDEAEGTVTHAGEIDLSTLPPFVDSPEEDDEVQLEDNEESSSATAVVTSDNVAPGGHLPEFSTLQESSQSLGQMESGAIGLEAPTTSENDTAPVEETSHALHDNLNEGTDAIAEPRESDKDPELQEDVNGDMTKEERDHPSDHTEISPQPEHNDHTNEEFTEDLDNHEEVRESLDGRQYESLQTDAFVSEELKEFDETWDDELDGEGDPDTTWEAEQDNGDESLSNESSVTLSSKASKRSFDEFGIENPDDEDVVSESPGPKRARVG